MDSEEPRLPAVRCIVWLDGGGNERRSTASRASLPQQPSSEQDAPDRKRDDAERTYVKDSMENDVSCTVADRIFVSGHRRNPENNRINKNGKSNGENANECEGYPYDHSEISEST